MPTTPKATPAKDAKAAKPTKRSVLTLEVTAEQILFAIGTGGQQGPLSIIVSEKWPLDFEVNYGLGRLVAKLEWERQSIETGRTGLLKRYAKVKNGEVLSNENGTAQFETPELEAAFRKAWQEAFREKTRTIADVRPLYASDFTKEVMAALKKDKYTAAALGGLSGSPFFIEDKALF